jgi:hypothetical protein
MARLRLVRLRLRLRLRLVSLLLPPLVATMLGLRPVTTVLMVLLMLLPLALVVVAVVAVVAVDVVMAVVRRPSFQKGFLWLAARASCLVRVRTRTSPRSRPRPRPRPSHSHRRWRWLSRLQYQLSCPHRYHRRDPIRRREGTALLQSDRV